MVKFRIPKASSVRKTAHFRVSVSGDADNMRRVGKESATEVLYAMCYGSNPDFDYTAVPIFIKLEDPAEEFDSQLTDAFCEGFLSERTVGYGTGLDFPERTVQLRPEQVLMYFEG